MTYNHFHKSSNSLNLKKNIINYKFNLMIEKILNNFNF